ncbi:hypothetical protein M595_6010 [Lyngbya aestuarii BL J]|uniref:Uncharacterized protein n=1 Tax=Lyngbya aestuarii BL J TaxID=1348334 RepID=U7Q894_9CYAN|nr:hypothetical protein [Lyngbya aestuarii]ERT04049.1 hypothetical protein M595_6010 [Lyngbya aestuarii BL J]
METDISTEERINLSCQGPNQSIVLYFYVFLDGKFFSKAFQHPQNLSVAE